MNTAIQSRQEERSESEKPTRYTSRMLERFASLIAKIENPEILDIGPIVGSNIDFFLQSAFRLSIGDFIRRIVPGNQVQIEQIRTFFDFRDNSFDAIHLWDIPDHVDDDTLEELVASIIPIVRPGGLVTCISSNAQTPQPFLKYLIIGKENQAEVRHLTAKEYPYHFRSNRSLEMLFKPLTLKDSFLNLNGVREFLFRR